MPKDRESYIHLPGLRNALEKEWRPLWKAMGPQQVAAEVMAGRGPAVDDGGWAVPKRNEARIWVEEELARRERSEGLARVQAWYNSVVATAALLVALAVAVLK